MMPILAQVAPATPAAGGMMERIFLILKADPILGFFALVLAAFAVVATTLWRTQQKQATDAQVECGRLRLALEAEQQKRVDLAMTVVGLQTKTGMVLDEAMATLTSVDDVLPAILSQLERLGVRRKPGSTGSHAVVVPPKTGGT